MKRAALPTLLSLPCLLTWFALVAACNGQPDAEAPAPQPSATESVVVPTASIGGTATPITTASAVAASGARKDGASCSDGAECESGVCEGPGCGADAGTCAPQDRRCLRDRRAFCGCDGKTFHAGSNCPGRRFSKAGKCEEEGK